METPAGGGQMPAGARWGRRLLLFGATAWTLLIAGGVGVVAIAEVIVCSFGSTGDCGPEVGLYVFGAIGMTAGLVAVARQAHRRRPWALWAAAIWGVSTVGVSLLSLVILARQTAIADSPLSILILPFVAADVLGLLYPAVLLTVLSSVCLVGGAAMLDRRLVTPAALGALGGLLTLALLPSASQVSRSAWESTTPSLPPGAQIQRLTVTSSGVVLDTTTVSAGEVNLFVSWPVYDTGQRIELIGPLEGEEIDKLAGGDTGWMAAYGYGGAKSRAPWVAESWGGGPLDTEGYLATVSLARGPHAWTWWTWKYDELGRSAMPELAGYAVFQVN